jgi:hypothetical protein
LGTGSVEAIADIFCSGDPISMLADVVVTTGPLEHEQGSRVKTATLKPEGHR